MPVKRRRVLFQGESCLGECFFQGFKKLFAGERLCKICIEAFFEQCFFIVQHAVCGDGDEGDVFVAVIGAKAFHEIQSVDGAIEVDVHQYGFVEV